MSDQFNQIGQSLQKGSERTGASRREHTTQLLQSLTQAEWRSVGGMTAAIAALHIIGWTTLTVFVDPQNLSVGEKTFGIGIGLTAYTLGMRHAFDADHIAAIDNTTRKLLSEGKRPVSVGFWFALGHSTIVFGLAVLLSFGVKALGGAVSDDSSDVRHYTHLIGTAISGSFLYLIAAVNIALLVGIIGAFRRLRLGNDDVDDSDIEDLLGSRGLLNRILGRFTRAITKPWQMYPVGVLFGLGFDTATEIALLVLAGTSAASAIPWYAILCLPVLFAAGMTLFDSIDGILMNFAYGWAFTTPTRKAYYNLVITGLSIVVAFAIATIELAGMLVEEFGWNGPFWTYIATIDLNTIGFAIVGLFFLTWLVAMAFWKIGKYDSH